MKSTARARGEIILDQVDVFKSDQKKLMAIQRDLASNVNNTFSELITVRDKAKQLQNQVLMPYKVNCA